MIKKIKKALGVYADIGEYFAIKAIIEDGVPEKEFERWYSREKQLEKRLSRFGKIALWLAGRDVKREDKLKQTASKPIQYVKGKKYRVNGAEIVTYLGEECGFPKFEFDYSKDGVDYKLSSHYTWEQVNAASVVEVIDD